MEKGKRKSMAETGFSGGKEDGRKRMRVLVGGGDVGGLLGI